MFQSDEMQNRRSLHVEAESPQGETETTNRTSSFTLRSSTNSARSGIVSKETPFNVTEPSPRRHKKPSRFPMFGISMLRAGLAGIRKQKRSDAIKKPCVWMDTPKEDWEDEIPAMRAKSAIVFREQPQDDRCPDNQKAADDIDLLINEGLINFTRNGPLDPSMFTLSRLPEAESASYVDSRNATPHATGAQPDGQDKTLRMRSSASSMANMSPRRPKAKRQDIWSCEASKDASLSQRSQENQAKKQQSDSCSSLNWQRRSISSIDFTNNSLRDSFSEVDSPVATGIRPQTRLDSRLCDGQTKGRSAAQVVTSGMSDEDCNERSLESIREQPASFRSDQVVFHNSVGYKQWRMDAGFLCTGRSEENACIGSKTRTSASVRQSADLRRMRPRGVGAASSPKRTAESKENEKCDHEQCGDSSSEAVAKLEDFVSVTTGSLPRDDDCSVVDEPKNLVMWLEWLEERSDVARKEILYRMGCQRAFIQEAQDKLESHALASDELGDKCQPTMHDRLAVVKRRYVKKARKSTSSRNKSSRRSLQIDDDEIIDISFDTGDDVDYNKPRRRSIALVNLNL